MATVRIQLRRGTAAEWASVDPVLAAGEMGLETDTGDFKFGDGTSTWSALNYALGDSIDDYIPLSEKGVADGVATLDSNGLIPLAQLPGAAALDAEVSSAINNHNAETTNIHGISDTSILVTTTGSQTLSSKSLLSPTLTGTPTAPTAANGTDNTQIATTEFVQNAIELVVGAAPEALNTLSEIATSLNNDADLAGTLTSAISEKVAKSGDTMSGPLTLSADPVNNLHAVTKQYVDSVANAGLTTFANDIETHRLDTTDVHGIADTSQLVTNSSLSSTLTNYVSNTTYDSAINDINSSISGINESIAEQGTDISNLETSTSAHAALATDVHGISNTADLVYTTDLTNQIAGANGYTDAEINSHNASTTSVHGIADTSLLATLSDVSNHNLETTNVHGIADTAALALTADVNSALDLKQDKVDGVSDTEIGYLDGVTSGIQAQIDGKSSTGHGHVISDVSGLEDQLVSKAPSDSPTFIGTVVLPSTTSIGDVSDTEIGYLDGVTSGIQAQIDGKASLSGAVFTGSVEIDQDLVVDGNLTVNGTTFSASSTSITIEDNLVQLAHENPANTVDLGVVVAYNDGSAKHAGIVRDVSADKWKLFKGVTTEPSTTVDFTQGSLDDIEVAGLTASSATIGDVSNTELQYLNGVTSAIQTQIDSKSPINNPTFTGTVTVSGSGIQFTDGTQTKQGVPSITTITQKTSNYTLSELSERDTLIEVDHTGGSPVTITVPADSTVNFPIGTSIDILRTNTGEVTIAGSGATVNATPGLKLRAQWSSATLFKRAANSWVLFGDLKA